MAGRRSSEGRGTSPADTWWTRAARRQSSSSSRERRMKSPDRHAPVSTRYQKRRSAPEVGYTTYRRDSTGRQAMVDHGSGADRRRRWNETVTRRHGEESLDSALTSGLPSPTESVASDYSSTASLSNIPPRGTRKDSGFRSIDTQSSYGAGRKNSSGGLRRQSFQTVDTDRHHSIPFVANPFELPGRASCRPVVTGCRSSGRRLSMFTRSDEVGGGDGDWLKEWLRWRSVYAGDTDVQLPPDLAPRHSRRDTVSVWNSLSEKVERTFEGFDRVISSATALLHDRRDRHIDC